MSEPSNAQLQAAKDQLDQHVRDIIAWHFSPETGTPLWLEWAAQQDYDPRERIQCFEDIISHFPHFEDAYLRDLPQTKFVPKGYAGKPYRIFETGGTTGMPKQRISWEDHLHDYSEFADFLEDEYFPRGGNWLMLGPTGPRRLRLAIEHLANERGGNCYHVDLDPRWVKKLIKSKQSEQAIAYKRHVVDQGVAILKGREISCLFTTPLLLEALGERVSLADRGVKGVFCGGTTMTPQMVRFLCEEVLEHRVQFVPTYGNTLMGLAQGLPIIKSDNYSVTYWAPQPRAVLRIVDPENTSELVPHGSFGRVELTTLTREFFMPRFLERDEAERRLPTTRHPWDGVGDVRPFRATQTAIVEGVY